VKVIIQKVLNASVNTDEKRIASITNGLVIFLCVMKEDTEEIAEKLAERILHLRLFDEDKRWQYSLKDIHGQILLISNFTLAANLQHGRRPNFTAAAPSEVAKSLYEFFGNYLKENDIKVQLGAFGAHMKVSLTNDGPVTLILDTETI